MRSASSGAVGAENSARSVEPGAAASEPSLSAVSTTIDTSTVATRRRLRFATLDDAVRDAEQLAEAERAGRLQRMGNWTLGQALGHLGAWNSYPFDGYPIRPAPWFIKPVLRLLKNKYLRDALPAGKRIPGVDNGTVGTELMETDEGLHRFRRSVERLNSTPPPLPSPAFGHLSHEQAKALAMRHAELHLSFFRLL